MYIWHKDAFKSLHQQQARLAHAILLQGPEGTGVFEFSLQWAQCLLCEAPSSFGEACGKCSACNWFGAGNHPDFRLLQPDSHVLEADAGDDAPRVTAREREKKSDQIRIDQVRELQSFLNVGTHRGGRRIVLVHPADAMNVATQNALLKNLEEPGPETVFFLVSTRAHRLLATVRSRCQWVRLPKPSRAEALQWLTEVGVVDAEELLALAGGAPLMAAAMSDRAEFLGQLADQLADRRMDVLALATICQRISPPELVAALYRWCYDLLSCRLAGQIRYHIGKSAGLELLAGQCSPKLIASYLRKLGRAQAIAEHPLNPRLFVEDLLFDYIAMIEGRFSNASRFYP